MRHIGIVVVATNAYFILGLRFIKKFLFYYRGDARVTFYLFTDTDPAPYLPDGAPVEYLHTTHACWADATNSKFVNILSLEHTDCDYFYYFDADTDISRPFTEQWFLGDLVGGEHYANRFEMAAVKNFDRNPASKAYVPLDTPLPQTYYYGAFFGGKKDRVIEFCKVLRANQLADREIPYEPGVNDESYINQYFHYHPPTYAVPSDQFEFEISHKGGLGETRDPRLDIEDKKKELLLNRDKVFSLESNRLVFY